MKKRIFVYILIFSTCLFYLLMPDVVFGQSAEQVFNKYMETFKRSDVKEFFPDVLRFFATPEAQEALNPTILQFFVKDPKFMQRFYLNADDSIVVLLTINDKFKKLFQDEQFHHIVLESPNQNQLENLAQLIEQHTTQTPGEQTGDSPEQEPTPTALSIVSGYGQEGLPNTSLGEPFVVEVRDQYGKAFPDTTVTFKATKGNGSVSPLTQETKGNGRAQTFLTPGRSAGVNVVEASVAGIDRPQIFTVTTIARPESPIPTTLEKVSGDNQTGEAGKPLAQPFIVGVKDQHNKAYEGANVTFRVTRGDGGFPISIDKVVKTDAYGQASVTLTLGSNVDVNLVRATFGSGLAARTVTFSAVAKSDALLPVYWIDNGAIYKFTGDVAERLVERANGWTATSLTVDTAGNKIYWTERQDGKQKGRIRSASLNGRNVETLQRRMGRKLVDLDLGSVPNGIVANADTRKLYWTSSRENNQGKIIGKIQGINFNGADFEGNFIPGKGKDKPSLDSLEHIVLAETREVASGEIYWTAYDTTNGWSIWSATLAGRVQAKEVMNLGKLGELTGLAVVGDKLYWAEKTFEGQGRIRSASRTGSSVKTLHVLEGSIPSGIAVDAAGSRLYWTSSNGPDSEGSIQRLNLDAPIQIVVEGLGNPTSIALGAVPAAAAPVLPAAPSTIVERSEQNVLLANYPNPFNPETWIPYNLAEPADVSVSIYAVNGQLIRTLDLGHQVAGVYRNRSRAAYWDGRNELGERVASGLYFYTLTAGDFTATRKMLIRK